MAYFSVKIINVIQIIMVVFILSWTVLDNNGFTYFKRGGNNCQYSYDLSAPRWIYFLFSFNLIDLFLSTNVSREFGNGLSILSSFVAVVLNVILAFVFGFYEIPFCNTNGSTVLGNFNIY